MFKRKLISLIISLCLLCGHLYAAPAITTATGTMSHGQTVTISGAGFGTKSTAAPIVWDDCESGVVTDYWTNIAPTELTGADEPRNIRYRTTAEAATASGLTSIPQAHSNSTKYVVGGHKLGEALSGINVVVAKVVGSYQRIYSSYYVRFSPEWDNANCTKNKSWYHMNGSVTFSDGGFYLEYSDGEMPKLKFVGLIMCDRTSQFSHETGHTTRPDEGWVKVEIIGDLYEAYADVQVYENGVLALDTVYAPYGVEHGCWTKGTTRQYVTFGGHLVTSGTYENHWRYIDDMYFDSSWQRVILGNSPTYSSCTVREVQPITAWADGEITVEFNQGAFSSGSAYLFVVDADGIASAGEQITIGSSSPSTPSLHGVSLHGVNMR